ncbi:MAG TPA: hypothetical protein VK447_03115 [Myxococcaceae bacterium]|nr:hypothetical protein [Myxococcaceae bacterium]
MIGPGISDQQLRELRTRVDTECTQQFNQIVQSYSQEGKDAKTSDDKRKARDNYESRLKAQGRACNAKRDKLLELERKPPPERAFRLTSDVP